MIIFSGYNPEGICIQVTADHRFVGGAHKLSSYLSYFTLTTEKSNHGSHQLEWIKALYLLHILTPNKDWNNLLKLSEKQLLTMNKLKEPEGILQLVQRTLQQHLKEATS